MPLNSLEYRGLADWRPGTLGHVDPSAINHPTIAWTQPNATVWFFSETILLLTISSGLLSLFFAPGNPMPLRLFAATAKHY